MKPFFILLLLSTLFYCCKKDKPYVPVTRCPDLTRNVDTINLFIHGTWVWQEEKRWDQVNGGYNYLTPTTEGYTLMLELSGDTARFYKNNIPDSTYKFQILRENAITNYPDDTMPVIAYFRLTTGVRKSYVPIKICEQQLLMQYQFVSSIVGETLWGKK